MNLFGRHHCEFVAALRLGEWERTPDGIVLRKPRALIQGVFRWGVRGHVMGEQHNLMTDEGLAAISADTQAATWHMALFGTDIAPTALWTGATFPATAGELTSGTEGYTEATRPAVVDFYAIAPTQFTIATATTLQVCGFGVLSGSAKGDTTGTLLSAIRFLDAPLALVNSDPFDAYYSVVSTPL